MILGLLAALAAADGLESWSALHDALLIESLDGDHAEAARRYEVLVRGAAADDPLRNDALYWLARARWIEGNVDAARQALREGVRTGGGRTPHLDLLDEIEIEAGAVRAVPTKMTFEVPQHGFVRPWYYRDKGVLRVEGGPGDGSLLWTTVVDARKDDQLHLGLRVPGEGPAGIRFTAQAEAFPADLRVLVFDVDGRRYTAGGPLPFVEVETTRARSVELRFDQLVPVDPNDPPLDPAAAERVVLQDVTAFQERRSGENRIRLRSFEVY